MSIPHLLGGRYEVGELVGRGGMAEVHAGHDTRLGRAVAIKMLRSDLARDTSFIQRFRREAQAAAGLNHPNIVAVFDSGEDHTTESGGATVAIPYIVMEFVEGHTLRELLNQQGHIEANEAARITEDVLEALAYSHSRGIVHRDMKPGNVMIAEDGSVKVMDFGIARAIADANATMTHTQAVIGTAQYLSPEQAQGQNVDHRSDIYSTGCLLFELLTGRPPFNGESPVAIAYQHVSEPPPRPSTGADGISTDLDAVVLHALSKDREKRYQTAEEFARDLRAARLGRPISGAARGALTAGGPALVPAAALHLDQPTQATPVTPGVRSDDWHTSSYDAVGDRQERRRGALWVMLIIASLTALILLGLAGKNILDKRAEENARVTVPAVVNMPQESAELKLRQQELEPVVVKENNDAPTGDVFDQDPSAGSELRKGEQVTIKVSLGPAQVKIPNLAGYTADGAKTALEQIGLKAGDTTQVDDTTTAKGKVVSTNPKAGVAVAKDSAVILNLSSGKMTVPSVVGKDVAEALSALSAKGFTARTVYQAASAKVGTVLSQDPSEGKADYGSQVTLVVATPPERTVTQTPQPTATQAPPTRRTPSGTSTTPTAPASPTSQIPTTDTTLTTDPTEDPTSPSTDSTPTTGNTP
ncbi:Stk1 family PASTA domain-containing Ser/Thr kinase [Actinomycetota bacterium]